MCLFSYEKPNFQHQDDRGSILQLIREGYCQINFVSTKAGSFRGGHYHKLNQELFYMVRGEIEVMLESRDGRKCVVFREGDMFSIPPYVKHSFTYLQDTEMIAMYDHGVELGDGKMDIYEDWE